MIVTKTPLRISFFSGGSDMKSFYSASPGAALSATIDKYINVCIHKTPNRGIRIMYDEVEDLDSLDKMNHEITKQTLQYFKVDREITIASLSDIPSKGSGLGSSSAFTVGLVNGCDAAYNGLNICSPNALAETACEVEIDRCGYPIGKQDQYAAAFGGLNLFQFNSNETVNVLKPTTNAQDLQKLENNLLLVYSGVSRSANEILKKHNDAIKSGGDKFKLIQKAVDRAFVAATYLGEGKIDDFGNLFHEAWMEKKEIAKGISQSFFDDVYDKAIKAGAIGGKLLGAGGGGFFLFYVSPEKRQNVINEINKFVGCKVYNFKFSWEGSKVVLK
jgi:D-glycero-alpha-D-manno-heptose-7-phosphate kinase